MTKRTTQQRTITEARAAQRERQARVYDAMGKLCNLSKGIGSMTISVGGKSFTIDDSNSARMVENSRAIAAELRKSK